MPHSLLVCRQPVVAGTKQDGTPHQPGSCHRSIWRRSMLLERSQNVVHMCSRPYKPGSQPHRTARSAFSQASARGRHQRRRHRPARQPHHTRVPLPLSRLHQCRPCPSPCFADGRRATGLANKPTHGRRRVSAPQQMTQPQRGFGPVVGPSSCSCTAGVAGRRVRAVAAPPPACLSVFGAAPLPPLPLLLLLLL